MAFSKIFQIKLYVIAIILFSTAVSFASKNTITETADIGKGIGIYRFELHKNTTDKSITWDGVSAEIRVLKKSSSDVLQRIPVDILMDSPYFEILDVNGDGYNDLLLYNAHAGYGAGPTTSADVFMFIPKQNKFVQSKTLSGIGNIELSKKRDA